MNSAFGFLSDEERVAERGAAALARVRHAMDRASAVAPTRDGADSGTGIRSDTGTATRVGTKTVLRTGTGTDTGTANLFAAANMLALALFHARRAADAAEMSRQAIECGHRLAARPGRTSLLFYVLQPQINLLRIEGFAGDADAALRGLAGLDDLAEGRAARVGELRFDDDAIAAAVAAGHPLCPLAGAVRILDTCKILFRRGRRSELLEFAARYPADRPAPAGPAHAAEAPWLVRPLDLPAPSPYQLPGMSRARARLGFVKLTHRAAAEDGRAAEQTVRSLVEQRAVLAPGTWLSALTPTRCLLSLAQTAARVGLDDVAQTLAAEGRDAAVAGGDLLLAAQAEAIEHGRPLPVPAEFDTVPAGELDHVTANLLNLLEEKGRAR